MPKIPDPKRDLFESPAKDSLFLSITHQIEKCESSNGYWACCGCPRKKECSRLFTQLSDISAKNELDSKKARYFLEQFGRILLY